VVKLDASQQSSVKVGDKAMITLPDGRTTPGVIARIGTVATSSAGNGSGSGSSPPTIPVYITLKHPEAAGSVDQATVQVQITTATVKHALAVPVTALVALADARYAVRAVDGHGIQYLVPVTVGLFEDANGLVQVTSQGLAAGQRVLLPGISLT
jgi:hypothetical protein